MKYLVVQFYDNDFGSPMLAALARIWGYIDNNNSVYSQRQRLTVTQVFEKLHECGALQPMLLRLFVLETLCREVESKTRALHHWDKWTEEEVLIDKPSRLCCSDTYLRCVVEIYGQYEAIPNIEWANECAYLNLTTGKVGIF